MTIPRIKVRYQVRPFIAAVCPEFHIKLGSPEEPNLMENFDELEALTNGVLALAVHRELGYFSTHPQEIRIEKERYLKVRTLAKVLSEIGEYVDYQKTEEGQIASVFGFKQ